MDRPARPPSTGTDPGYTGGLNRWEHEIYQKELRAGGRGATTSRDRLRAKGRSLEERQKTLTGKSFREREASIEMLEAEERRLSGKRGTNPGCAQVPELHIPTHIDGAKREDIPMPPPQSKAEEQRLGASEGADDVRSDPSRAIAEQTGDADALVDPHSRWTFDATDTDDEEDD